MSNKVLESIAAVVASKSYGVIVRRPTVVPIPSKFRDNPPLIKIMERHICLVQSAHTSGYFSFTKSPKKFLAIHPNAIMPTNEGH